MMKRIIYTSLLAVAMFSTACEKDDIGDTATVALAGEWYVVADAVDNEGNVVFSDDELFGIGRFLLNTYNTAANIPTEMFVDDNRNFWDFKVKTSCNVEAKTFASPADTASNLNNDCQVILEGGKVIYDGATTPSGVAADSIVFYVSFSDDEYPALYGYSKYRISGFRYTGLTNDD